MKTPPNHTEFESAPDKRDYTPGSIPKRINTVTAAVLAGLLESKEFTGMESVFKQSTTRLSAVIDYLEKRYGWSIDRRKIAVGTSDGRIPDISIYWLPQATIAEAFESGAREWIKTVNNARLERRKHANECKVKAAQKNAAQKPFKQNPRQDNLWE